MSLEQRDLSAQWGIGCSTHGANGPRVTWATLTQAEREDVKSAWVVVDQKREIVHAREVETSRKNWDAGIAALPTREKINSAMVGMAQESIRFVRATVQDELSRAINPLSNEILPDHLDERTAFDIFRMAACSQAIGIEIGFPLQLSDPLSNLIGMHLLFVRMFEELLAHRIGVDTRRHVVMAFVTEDTHDLCGQGLI